MKNVQRFLFTAFLTTSLFQLQAQTADEVISKHIEALGGKAKVAGVKSTRIENTMSVMGNDAPNITTVLIGKGYKNETEFQGQKIVQILTDKGGWAMNPMAGSADLQPIPAEQYNMSKEAIYYSPFFDYATLGAKVELAGKEKLGDKEAFKVNYTSKENFTTTYYIDPATYYIVKEVKKANMMGQDVEVVVLYSDYKKTDYGVVIPYKVDTDYGGQFQISSTVKKAEINPTVDPAIFVVK